MNVCCEFINSKHINLRISGAGWCEKRVNLFPILIYYRRVCDEIERHKLIPVKDVRLHKPHKLSAICAVFFSTPRSCLSFPQRWGKDGRDKCPRMGLIPKSRTVLHHLEGLHETCRFSVSSNWKSSATLKSTISGLKWQATAEQWDLSSIWISHKFVGRASGRATFQFIHTGSWNPIITIMMPSILLLHLPPPRRVFMNLVKMPESFRNKNVCSWNVEQGLKAPEAAR